MFTIFTKTNARKRKIVTIVMKQCTYNASVSMGSESRERPQISLIRLHQDQSRASILALYTLSLNIDSRLLSPSQYCACVLMHVCCNTLTIKSL